MELQLESGCLSSMKCRFGTHANGGPRAHASPLAPGRQKAFRESESMQLHLKSKALIYIKNLLDSTESLSFR